jgi:CHASE3 domain sensor protein
MTPPHAGATRKNGPQEEIMDNVQRTGGRQGRWLIIGGFALLGVILIAAAAVSAWQAGVHDSRSAEMESRTATVSLLQDVEEESGIAATLLQEYVATGDATLIPQIQSHSNAAMGSLREATAESDVAGIDDMAADGAGLNQGATQIVALRLSGDAQAAAAALEAATPAFEELNLGLAGITEQLQDVDALQGRADRASDLSRWSLIVAAAAGVTLGFATLTLLARSLIRRRAARPALPA